MQLWQASQLLPGNQVTWNDPDTNASCSTTGIIETIEYMADGCFWLCLTNGWEGDVLASELS